MRSYGYKQVRGDKSPERAKKPQTSIGNFLFIFRTRNVFRLIRDAFVWRPETRRQEIALTILSPFRIVPSVARYSSHEFPQ